MKNRLLWVVLAVSLALNLSFVGVWGYSAVTANETAKEDSGFIDEVADHLLLNDEQRSGLLALRAQAQGRWRSLTGDSGSLREAFARSLAAERFDRAQAEALVSGRFQQRAEVISAIMGDLHAFMATLSPEQRDAMLVLVERRGFLRSLFSRRSKSAQMR